VAKNPSAKTPASESSDQVTINYNFPVEMPSVFATNLVIQPGEFEVIVSFFELQPPLLTSGDQGENIEILKKIGIRADCVSRITIAKERFEGFANAMKKVAADMKAAEKKK
jgi:hypothetical protein